MVTDAELKTYAEHGYCLVRGLIDPAKMAAVRKRSMDMIDATPEWGEASFHWLDPQEAKTKAGKPLYGSAQSPSRYEDVFKAVAENPALKTAMSKVIGDDVRLYTDQTGIKHDVVCGKEQGGCSYYHQDSWYWHIDPSQGCNVWIPTDKVGAEAIGLAIKPGSQKGWALTEHEQYFDDPKIGKVIGDTFTPFKRHRIPRETIDYSDEIIFEMEPGDALFFSNYTWHRSEPNRSGETKMFYAIAYKLTDEAIARQG